MLLDKHVFEESQKSDSPKKEKGSVDGNAFASGCTHVGSPKKVSLIASSNQSFSAVSESQ